MRVETLLQLTEAGTDDTRELAETGTEGAMDLDWMLLTRVEGVGAEQAPEHKGD